MKITKSQLQKIIKEELLKEAGRPHSMRSGRTMADLDTDAATRETDYIPSKSTELDLARDSERSADPFQQIDALALASHLEERGYTLTRGGYNKVRDFLEDMLATGDLRHPMDK